MNNKDIVKASLKKRYAKEKRFKIYGIISITLSFLFLAFLLADITGKSLPAFTQTYVKLEIDFSHNNLKLKEKASYSEDELFKASYRTLASKALYQLFPDIKSRKDKKNLKRYGQCWCPI